MREMLGDDVASGSGELLSDQRADLLEDVGPEWIDINWVSMASNTSAELIVFSHTLRGRVNKEGTSQYAAFLDLGADPGTGGPPAWIGFPTAFGGAEIVTRVIVDPRQGASATAWAWDGSTFVDVTDRGVRAMVDSPRQGPGLPEVEPGRAGLPSEDLELGAGRAGPALCPQGVTRSLRHVESGA